jgi:hypothetical protein
MTFKSMALAGVMLVLPVLASGSITGGSARAASTGELAAGAVVSLRFGGASVQAGRPRVAIPVKARTPSKAVARVKILPRY